MVTYIMIFDWLFLHANLRLCLTPIIAVQLENNFNGTKYTGYVIK